MERLGHRPALDGVRGIAIALVVGGHMAGWPRNGSYGVDLFFVLSGFLITTLLLEEHRATGRIALRAFYVRRARRLFPALFAMLVLAFLLSSATFTPREMVIVFGSALFYVSNFVRAFTHPDQLSGGPTNHLWSLAAEEQFYTVWPAALLFLLRRRVALVQVLTAFFVALVSYRLGMILAGASPARIYFGPDTHAEGIVLGCLVAALRMRHVRVAWFLGWAGLVGIGLLAFTRPPHEWVFGLPVVEVAAAAVLLTSLQPGLLQRALSVRPLVYLGVISYSLYVWHMFALYATFWHHRVIAAVLAVPLTLCSYYLVERPFRRRRAKSDRVHASPSTVLTEA